MDRIYFPTLNLKLSNRRLVITRRETDGERKLVFEAKPRYKMTISGEEVVSGTVRIFEGKHERDGKEFLGGIDSLEPWTQSEAMTIQELLEKRKEHIKEKGKSVPFEHEEAIIPASFQAAIWVDSATFSNLIQANLYDDVIYLGIELATVHEKSVEVIHWLSAVVWDGVQERNIRAKSFDLAIQTPEKSQEKKSDVPEEKSDASVLTERVAQLEAQLIPRVAGMEKTLLWIFGILVGLGVTLWFKK